MTRASHRTTLLVRVLVGALLAAGTITTLPGCGGKSPKEGPVEIPPVTNLREAADHLVSKADQIEGPPSWMNHPRDTDVAIYAIGTARAKRDAAQDLFSAMENGRSVLITSLADSGLDSAPPLGFSSDLEQDPSRIQFEELAYDTNGHKWYVLAVLDRAGEAAEAKQQFDEIDQLLEARKAVTLEPRTSSGDRVRAALSLLHLVDERAQWNARYTFFDGEPLAVPQGLERGAIVRLARSVLQEHQVRVIVEGAPVPGLEDAIASVLGQFYIGVSEFGSGLVLVTLEETTSESAGMELLVLDGLMQMTLEGETGSAVSRPLRAVTTYDNLDAARARNARIIDTAAMDATREAIHTLLD